MSPKRAFFSLNVDSQSEHIYPRVEEQHTSGRKIIETSSGDTDLSSVTKPFEKAVNRAVDDVVQSSTGKKVHSVDGDLHYTTEKSSSSSGTSTNTSTLAIRNKSSRRAIERKYDTSDL